MHPEQCHLRLHQLQQAGAQHNHPRYQGRLLYNLRQSVFLLFRLMHGYVQLLFSELQKVRKDMLRVNRPCM